MHNPYLFTLPINELSYFSAEYHFSNLLRILSLHRIYLLLFFDLSISHGRYSGIIQCCATLLLSFQRKLRPSLTNRLIMTIKLNRLYYIKQTQIGFSGQLGPQHLQPTSKAKLTTFSVLWVNFLFASRAHLLLKFLRSP